jgi:LysR family glycine cleavage system transcriptional activator
MRAMNRRLPPLTALRAFEAAARHGSFKEAAAELSLTPTAISHQVRALEAHLGVKLFERQTRLVRLTAPGQHLGAALRESFDGMAEALTSIMPRRATVTLSTTPAFAAQWVLPRLDAFAAAHGDIDLRLHASNALADLHGGEVDLAIRYGRGRYAGLTTHFLMADRFVPVASPRLMLSKPADLLKHPLIHFEWHRPDRSHPSWQLWFKQAGLRFPTRRNLRFTEESHAIQAAVAGQGVALLSEVLVANEIARGLLHCPFGPALDSMSYHLVWADATPKGPAPANAAMETVKAWIARMALEHLA